jgi:hypothetical protein
MYVCVQSIACMWASIAYMDGVIMLETHTCDGACMHPFMYPCMWVGTCVDWGPRVATSCVTATLAMHENFGDLSNYLIRFIRFIFLLLLLLLLPLFLTYFSTFTLTRMQNTKFTALYNNSNKKPIV